ncbi:MAG: hypothetical protein AAF653_19685, partial [Chloroflexota bacterium]
MMVRAVTRIVYGLLALMVGAALFGRWATDPLMLRVSYSESTGNSFEPPHHFQLIDVQKSHAVFLDKNTPLAQHWNTITNEHLYSDIVYPSPDGAQYYIATYGDTENTSGLYWSVLCLSPPTRMQERALPTVLCNSSSEMMQGNR